MKASVVKTLENLVETIEVVDQRPAASTLPDEYRGVIAIDVDSFSVNLLGDT